MHEAAQNLLQSIDKYYQYTFRLKPEKCNAVLLSIIEQLGQLADVLPVEHQQGLQVLLQQAISALEKKDYVLLRDILHYDIRTLLYEFIADGGQS